MSSKSSQGVLELKIKFDETCKYGHTLFIKEHSLRNMELKQNNTTILVLNIPPYCDEEDPILQKSIRCSLKQWFSTIITMKPCFQKCLKKLFGKCGKIVDVHEQKNPGKIEKKNSNQFFGNSPVTGFHVAYIKFKSRKSIASVEKFVRQNKSPLCLSHTEEEIPTGIKKMCLDYISSFPDFSELENEINSYMQEHDAKVEQKEVKEQKEVDQEDDDGWIKVTKSGKQPSFSRTEAGEIKLRAKLKRKQEKEKGFNIYNYQIREAKRAKILELRNKFEEDKRKVEAMKQARKFRPF